VGLHDFAEIDDILFGNEDFIDHFSFKTLENVFLDAADVRVKRIQNRDAIVEEPVEDFVDQGGRIIAEVFFLLCRINPAQIEEINQRRQLVAVDYYQVVRADEEIDFRRSYFPGFPVIHGEKKDHENVILRHVQLWPLNLGKAVV